MRFKIVPEPPIEGGAERDADERDGESEPSVESVVDALERATRAVPLVPATEEECCARLLDRLGLAAHDAAREWLAFLRALGLVVETESGFRRHREDWDPAELAVAFRECVYGVQEVLGLLNEAEEPLSADAVAERFGEHVPQWERFRYPDPGEIWGERVSRILDWAVWFGLAKRTSEGYLADDPPG